MASRRAAVSVLASAPSASARDFGGSGNALPAPSVSAPASSTITYLEGRLIMFWKSVAAILALLVASLAFAADSAGPASRADPMMDRYSAAASKQDWKSAASVMRDAVAAAPRNPDYPTLSAYSLRKGGSAEMDLVFKPYNEALRLDPGHR